MDEVLGFTKEFYLFFNEKKDFDSDERSEDKALVDNKLRELYGSLPVYYTGQENDLVTLQLSSDYNKILDQFRRIRNHIQPFFFERSIASLFSLTQFFERLLFPETNHVTIFFKEEGKRKLEEISILLNDKTINPVQRIGIANELLISDGLSQCLDNCYILISSIHDRLKLLKKAQGDIYSLVRNFASEAAIQAATSKPFAINLTFQEILCAVNKELVLSHEVHAKNFFLMYASENDFPVNIHHDVIAQRLGSTFHDDLLKKNYINRFKEIFTVSGLVDYLVTMYRFEIMEILASNDFPMDKINKINFKLQSLGNDQGFTLHEILEEKEGVFLLKPEKNLMITIVERLLYKQWITKPIREEIMIENKPFIIFYFKQAIDLSWIMYFDETESQTVRTNILTFFADKNLRGELPKDLLREQIIKSKNFINNQKSLDLIFERNPSLSKFVPDDIIIEILENNLDSISFIKFLEKLEEDRLNRVLKKLHFSAIKPTLIRVFTLIQQLMSNKNLKKIAIKNEIFSQSDLVAVSHNFIIKSLASGFKNFNNLFFPDFLQIDYLSYLDFSECDFCNSLISSRITHSKFTKTLLDNVSFMGGLDNVFFVETDLRHVKFSQYGWYSELQFHFSKFSTETFKSLLAFDIVNYRYADLREVDFQAIQMKNVHLDFSFANLDACNLSLLDLRNVNLMNTILKNTDLRGIQFDANLINSFTDITGAKINFDELYLFSIKIKKFDQCSIYPRVSIKKETLIFKNIYFNQVNFYGHVKLIEMSECVLLDVKFTTFSDQEISRVTKVKFKNSEFKAIKFLGTEFVSFSIEQCKLSDIVLNNVKISAEVFFKFYELGHRDFSAITTIYGDLPKKLPNSPFAEAILSTAVFKFFLARKVYDFKFANLENVFIDTILREMSVEEKNLSLEGAVYKPGKLICNLEKAALRTSRDLFAKKCIISFSIYSKFVSAQEKASLNEFTPYLNTPAEDIRHTYHYKEVNVDFVPTLLLENPDEINFYWKIKPKDDLLVKVLQFLKKSVPYAVRNKVEVINYIFWDLSHTSQIKLFSNKIIDLRFKRSYVVHYRDYQAVVLPDNDPISVEFTNKLKSNLLIFPRLEEDNKKLENINLFSKKQIFNFKKKLSYIPKAIKKEGGQYDLVYTLLYYISVGIYSRKAEIQEIDIERKQNLKQFAKTLIEQEAPKKGLSEYQSLLITDVTYICIDRNECSSEELVYQDVKNSLDTIKTDAMVTGDFIRTKFVEYFQQLSTFVQEKFSMIKKAFENLLDSSTDFIRKQKIWYKTKYIFHDAATRDQESHGVTPSVALPLIRLNQTIVLGNPHVDNQTSEIVMLNVPLYNAEFVKEIMKIDIEDLKLYNWYENDDIVELVKLFNLVFEYFDFSISQYDLSQDELSGLLCNFWLHLNKYLFLTKLSPVEFFENRNPLPVYENYTTVTADEKFTENEKISAKKSMFQNKRSVKWPLLFFKNEISEHSLIDNQDNENFSVKKQARTNIQKKLNQALPIERQLSINPQLFFSCVNDTLILANFTLKCANYFLSSKQTTFQANDEILTSIETKSKQKTP